METQTKEKVQEGELVEIILGESFDLSKIKPNNAIVVADGKKELLSRIIPFQDSYLVCTLSKTPEGIILEKTYDYLGEELKYSSENEIEKGHLSYETLNEQINENLK